MSKLAETLISKQLEEGTDRWPSGMAPAHDAARRYRGKTIDVDYASELVTVTFLTKQDATKFTMELDDLGYEWNPIDARTIEVEG